MNKEEVYRLINGCFYNSKPIVPDSKKSVKMIEILEECFTKEQKTPPKSLKALDMNLEEISYCVDDVIADVLCREGFEENWEPNEYGLELEEAIDFFNHFRFVLDDPNYFRKKLEKISKKDKL